MRDSTANERPVEMHGFKYIRLKSGRMITFWDCLEAAESAQSDMVRAVSRAFKLARDGDGEDDDDDLGRDDDLERIEWFIDALEDYTAALRRHLDERLATVSKRDRIKRLRNTAGRTPEEAALFKQKADELEARSVSGRGS